MHLRNPLDPTQASSPPSTTMILTFEGRVFAAGRRCAMQLRVIQTLPSSQTLPDFTSAFPRPPSRQLGFDPVVLTSWLTKAGQTLFEPCLLTCVHTPQVNVKGTTDPSHWVLWLIKHLSSKQKLQKALKSWSNFSLVLFGKGWKLHKTTSRNPCNNFNKSK